MARFVLIGADKNNRSDHVISRHEELEDAARSAATQIARHRKEGDPDASWHYYIADYGDFPDMLPIEIRDVAEGFELIVKEPHARHEYPFRADGTPGSPYENKKSSEK